MVNDGDGHNKLECYLNDGQIMGMNAQHPSFLYFHRINVRMQHFMFLSFVSCGPGDTTRFILAFSLWKYKGRVLWRPCSYWYLAPVYSPPEFLLVELQCRMNGRNQNVHVLNLV